jgi:restriction endonuclease S subunit
MRTQGIGVPDLGLNEISRFPVPLPPSSEQQDIADYLDEKEATLRSLAKRVNDGIEQLHEYRSALISAAVTGKIDVRREA